LWAEAIAPRAERRASVTLVCECDEVETHFKRTIHSSGHGDYRVDNKVVKPEQYSQRLKAVGVNTKAHTGFLVFQGYVSELAAKTPRELTALFEQISGSEELKKEYEELELKKKQARRRHAQLRRPTPQSPSHTHHPASHAPRAHADGTRGRGGRRTSSRSSSCRRSAASPPSATT